MTDTDLLNEKTNIRGENKTTLKERITSCFHDIFLRPCHRQHRWRSWPVGFHFCLHKNPHDTHLFVVRVSTPKEMIWILSTVWPGYRFECWFNCCFPLSYLVSVSAGLSHVKLFVKHWHYRQCLTAKSSFSSCHHDFIFAFQLCASTEMTFQNLEQNRTNWSDDFKWQHSIFNRLFV